MKHMDQVSRIMNWARLVTVEAMESEQADQARNRRAESAHVRKVAWGDESGLTDGEDDVKTTILGDVQQQPPIVVSSGSNGSSLAPLVLAALMGTAIPTIAAGAYWLAKQEPADVSFSDETVRIGLGRIEDYIAERPTE